LVLVEVLGEVFEKGPPNPLGFRVSKIL